MLWIASSQTRGVCDVGDQDQTVVSDPRIISLWEVIREWEVMGTPIPVATHIRKCTSNQQQRMTVPSTIEERRVKDMILQRGLDSSIGASSTNNINTVNPEVSTATTKVNTASTKICTASFKMDVKWKQWQLLSMRARNSSISRTGRKSIIDGVYLPGQINQSSLKKAVKDWEDALKKAMCDINGAGLIGVHGRGRDSGKHGSLGY
ncbi:hypothetical protein Tco_1229714 [Tanacetum coccineum]